MFLAKAEKSRGNTKAAAGRCQQLLECRVILCEAGTYATHPQGGEGTNGSADEAACRHSKENAGVLVALYSMCY